MIEKNEMIFGVRAVIEAIQAGKEIDKVLVKKDIQSDLSKELFSVLKETFIPVQRVPVERINRITKKNHQGVVAFISPITYQRTEDIVPFLFEQGKNPLLIMLDGRWWHFDATPGPTHSRYSLMNDAQRYETLVRTIDGEEVQRDWDRSKWPACP